MERKASKLLEHGAAILKNAGIIDWDYDSRFLLEWVCHIKRIDLILDPHMTVTAEDWDKYDAYIRKRASHEPLQYLIGEWEFMGLPFMVNPSVLIPRQDTECLIEWILEEEKKASMDFNHVPVKILDVCTGSGCIAISLDKLWDDVCKSKKQVEALDLSKGALETARKNNLLNQTNVVLKESDMFEKIKGRYDIIVSNPPYIPTKVVDELMAEVVEHEPRMALDGMEDGLFFYRILAAEGKNHLLPGGRMYLEIGHDQGESVPKLLEKEGFIQVEVKKDLSGKDRCIRAVFPG